MYYIIGTRSQRQLGRTQSLITSLVDLRFIAEGTSEHLIVVTEKEVQETENIINVHEVIPDAKTLYIANQLYYIGKKVKRSSASRDLFSALIRVNPDRAKTIAQYKEDMFRPQVYRVIRQILPGHDGAEVEAYLSSLYPTIKVERKGAWAKHPRRILLTA